MAHSYKDNRYNNEIFKQQQKTTLKERCDILPLLNLDSGREYEKWIEMPTKHIKDEHKDLPKVRAIENLRIVHPIKRDNTPVEVLHRARGVIVYNNEHILRNSIPYSETRTVKSEGLEYEGPQVYIPRSASGWDSITANVKDIRINEYIEGTVIDIMLSEGELLFVTSRNLVADGLEYNGTRVFKPASIESYHTPFIKSFTDILAATGNVFVLDKKAMFGEARFSPYIYRFILVTRERVKASTVYINEQGFLIYLGALEQWSYKDKQESFYGSTHDIYELKNTVPDHPPRDKADVPYIIVRPNEGLTVEQANELLIGNPNVDYRFSGGGKLIITGTDVKGDQFLSHIQSRSYEHRANVIGQSTNEYDSFVAALSLKKYDFGVPVSIGQFYEKFAPLYIPDIPTIYNQCNSYEELSVAITTVNPDARQLLRTMWYNYLVCSNVSVRPRVCLFLKRYIVDREALVSWIRSKNKSLHSESLSVKDSNRLRSFVTKTELEIERSRSFQTGGSYQEGILFIEGEKAARLISICRKETNTKQESILISEPQAKFYSGEKKSTKPVVVVAPKKSYADLVKKR